MLFLITWPEGEAAPARWAGCMAAGIIIGGILLRPFQHGRARALNNRPALSAIIKLAMQSPAPGHSATTSLTAAEFPASSASAAAALKLRALVVDDNLVNLQLCQAFLVKLGYHTTTAKNGLDALRLMQTQPFDVVVMDHQMPVMDGCTATKIYRDWEKEKAPGTHLPIIALTANASLNEADFYLSSGMDYFLAKPLKLPRLVEALDQTLKRAGQSAEPVPAPADAPTCRDSQSTIMNIGQALDLAGNDAVLLSLLSAAFIAQSAELREGLRTALANEDGPALVNSTHKLKGAVGLFAAETIFAATTAINQATAPYNWPQLRAQGAKLDADIERLVKELASLANPGA